MPPPPLRARNDRRKARRLLTRLRVDFCPLVNRLGGLAIGQMQRGVALNISQSGLYVTEAGHLEVGAVLHLFLRLPEDNLVCFARVVRHDYHGCGIQLLRLKETDRRRLARYVERLAA